MAALLDARRCRLSRPSVWFLIAFLVSIAGTATCGPDPGQLIGSLLDGLANEVTTIANNAAASGDAVVLAAAGAVGDAISNAESAFANDLNTGINNVSDSVRSVMNNLTDLVSKLKTSALEVLQAVTEEAQVLINSLPFANHNPQVRTHLPQFVGADFVSAPGATVNLIIKGNFFWVFHQDLTPKLKVNGQELQPTDKETTTLEFQVPGSAFGQPSPGKISRTTLELNVPYEEGRIFKSIHPGVFDLQVSVLPTRPATNVELDTQQPVDGVNTTVRRFPDATDFYHYDSYHDCLDHVDTLPFAPDDKYKWIPASYAPVFAVLRNPNNVHLTPAIFETSGSLKVETDAGVPCVPGIISVGSGSVTFAVTITEQAPTHTTRPETEALNLNWGDRLVRSVPRGQWVVKATLFNGQTVEINDTYTSDRYLSVTNAGNSITIAVLDPETMIEGITGT